MIISPQHQAASPAQPAKRGTCPSCGNEKAFLIEDSNGRKEAWLCFDCCTHTIIHDGIKLHHPLRHKGRARLLLG